MMASGFFASAIVFTANGSSHDPGTFTTSMLFPLAPERFNASIAPLNRRSVIRPLNLATTTTNLKPLASRFPSIAWDIWDNLISGLILPHGSPVHPELLYHRAHRSRKVHASGPPARDHRRAAAARNDGAGARYDGSGTRARHHHQ